MSDSCRPRLSERVAWCYNAEDVTDKWTSKLGVILAVSGSAVGLGNFLRFPGKAATYGGVFMVPYVVSLLFIGIPIAWAEWTIGRYAGARGFHSAPAVFRLVWPRRFSPYLGVIALVVPLVISMYYVFIEAWCLGYAWYYVTGDFPLPASLGDDKYSAFFNTFVGARSHGLTNASGHIKSSVWFLLIVFIFNFWLVARGISKGIEAFTRVAMPLLIGCALIVLVRVLTLDAPDPVGHPEQTVLGGLGFMWNPRATEQLPGWVSSSLGILGIHASNVPESVLSIMSVLQPQIWLEAAGQVFFSLSVGFGIIICYSSYLSRDEDVVLSGLTACATNEFCEVCLGGLITVPAAFLFLGAAPLAGVLGSTLSLGFHTFPQIFEMMPLGRVFGFVWFLLLFLAAITSSVSMLFPVMAFVEEGFGLKRKTAALAVTPVSLIGALLVVYFSKNLLALDIMDFWVGSVMIFILGTITVIAFAWAFPVERGIDEANRGADVRIPRSLRIVFKWICPAYLLIIMGAWMAENMGPQLANLLATAPARITACWIVLITVSLAVSTAFAVRRWERTEAGGVP